MHTEVLAERQADEKTSLCFMKQSPADALARRKTLQTIFDLNLMFYIAVRYPRQEDILFGFSDSIVLD